MSADGGYAAKRGQAAPGVRPTSEGVVHGDDFPILCETCLGSNPYVRMIKLPYGQKLCKITNGPYQAFRWKAGPNGRYKETIVCADVAKHRNICQTCLNDMKFGLPVGMRDALLSQEESRVVLPHSEVGQRYHYAQLAEQEAVGSAQGVVPFAVDMQNLAASRQLDKFSRDMHSSSSLKHQVQAAVSVTPFRNLPKLCSFWLNGACNRVLKKTCPFRPCCGPSAFAFPEIAGSNPELCKQLITELQNVGPAAVMKSMDAETKKAINLAMKGNRDEAIRKRVAGDDDLTKKYMGRMRQSQKELIPPDDPNVTTLWLGNVDAAIGEQDVMDSVYAYGHVIGLHIARASNCAFVTYASREMAVHAASQLYNNLNILGRSVTVNWARPKAQAASSEYTEGEGGGAATDVLMPAPPGFGNAQVSQFALPGIGLPVLSFVPPPPPLPPQQEEKKGEGEEQDPRQDSSADVAASSSSSVLGVRPRLQEAKNGVEEERDDSDPKRRQIDLVSGTDLQ